MIRRRKFRFYKGEFADIVNYFLNKHADANSIELFEREFSRYIGTTYAIATSSGRHVLELVFDALGIRQGDEIIMAAYTLKDLVDLMERRGIRVVLADVQSDSFTIDPHAIKKCITNKTKAIIITHLFGMPCDIDEILKLKQQYGVTIIEDCAHALGAEYDGKKVGSFGDISLFSFEKAKLINTFGGGMLTTNDKKIAAHVRSEIDKLTEDKQRLLKKIMLTYIEHFVYWSPFYYIIGLVFASKIGNAIIAKVYLGSQKSTQQGYSRFSSLQATIGLRLLRSLDENNQKRSILAQRLHARVSSFFIPQTCLYKKTVNNVYYYYVARLKKNIDLQPLRRLFFLHGLDVGIGSEITDNCDAEHIHAGARTIYDAAIQFPMYDDLPVNKIDQIERILNKTMPTQRS